MCPARTTRENIGKNTENVENEGGTAENPGRATDRLAADFGISRQTIERARDVLQHGKPEQTKAVVPLVRSFFWLSAGQTVQLSDPSPLQKNMGGGQNRTKNEPLSGRGLQDTQNETHQTHL